MLLALVEVIHGLVIVQVRGLIIDNILGAMWRIDLWTLAFTLR